MLGLFAGPRVAPRMRTFSFVLIAAAALSTFACGPSKSDKLEDNELATAEGNASAVASDDRRCTARFTHDELKRQLFARAAEIRGSNSANYARIAGFAVLQLDGAAPVAATSSSALADCRANATLRLPSGLKVAGGRTTLSGDIGYSVGAGGRGTVTLGQSDSIAIPLATLSQIRAAPPPVAAAPDPLAPANDLAPAPAADPASAAAVRPSFDCRSATTRSEQSVCASPALAALDQAMAARYRAAFASGNGDQTRLLGFTRDRFLEYRDRCTNDACIANVYRGRMREIDDILAGRWRGER
jgi:hypothetical protein